MRLKDKVAIITGSGGSIGSTAAKRFALEGAKVVVTDINAKGGNATVEEIKALGGEALFVEADITKATECEKIVKSAIDIFRRVDVLFNNAGFSYIKPLHECTEKDYHKIVDVHLKGSFFCTRYVLGGMMQQAGGSIINMGSVAGLVGYRGVPLYCAAKGALSSLTRYVALEYGSYNIRCNCLCPGAVSGGIGERYLKENPDIAKRSLASYPLGRFAERDEIVHAAVFLASDESSYITGVNLPVDGGYVAG
jgi:NAD(P)-dependent dehydrogenase (short-subunit alcohol dehydrogenase family)